MNINSLATRLYYKQNETEKILFGPPLDFSFQDVDKIEDLITKRAQSVRTGKIPSRTRNDRYITGTLWLSHNSLINMSGLQALVKSVLHDPVYLSWLDLSFNMISKIEDEVTEFPNLKILYLHENNISDIKNIFVLRKLKHLRRLSLHSNPIATFSYYRGYVVHILPQLLNLDFSPISKAERKNVCPVGFFKMLNTIT